MDPFSFGPELTKTHFEMFEMLAEWLFIVLGVSLIIYTAIKKPGKNARRKSDRRSNALRKPPKID